jgi:hypothetical protein
MFFVLRLFWCGSWKKKISCEERAKKIHLQQSLSVCVCLKFAGAVHCGLCVCAFVYLFVSGDTMNGHANGAGLASRGTVLGAPPPKGGSVDKAADFANYFCTYAFLYHQKEMLSDRVRMDAYYNAIFRNARHFQGKVSCIFVSQYCCSE